MSEKCGICHQSLGQGSWWILEIKRVTYADTVAPTPEGETPLPPYREKITESSKMINVCKECSTRSDVNVRWLHDERSVLDAQAENS